MSLSFRRVGEPAAIVTTVAIGPTPNLPTCAPGKLRSRGPVCSSRRRGATLRATRQPECTGIGAPGGAAARCLRRGRRPPAALRTAIELRLPCPLRWRRSVATAIRRRGRHALVCRRRRPWRRYGGVGPTIGHRLRRRSSGAGRSRRWLGTRRGAAAASLAPRRRRGQLRGAGAAVPARGVLCGQRRHSELLLRVPLRLRNVQFLRVPGGAPGRVQAGAGGVLTGLEGVAGCSKGRRDRIVRHGAVTSSAKPVKCSADFLALFAQSCSAARRGSNASAATRSFLDMSYSERIHLPEGGDLAGTLGHHRRLGHYLTFRDIPCHDASTVRWSDKAGRRTRPVHRLHRRPRHAVTVQDNPQGRRAYRPALPQWIYLSRWATHEPHRLNRQLVYPLFYRVV